MKEQSSVPEEFKKFSKKLFAKKEITEREFVDLCLLAIKLIDNNWEYRQGMAYHIVGAWLEYPNIDKDDLLDQIGAEFGELELPDQYVEGGPKAVRQKWTKLKNLVAEADEKY